MTFTDVDLNPIAPRWLHTIKFPYRTHSPARPRWRLPIIVLVAFASVLPILFLRQIPFVDAPNHLARFFILDHLHGDPDLSRFFEPRSGFFPYWGTYIVIRGLSPFVGVEVAAHIFAVLALLSPPLGTLALSRAVHGEIRIPALLSFGLSMNLVASWGFLNFLMSLGFVMAGLGLWLSLDRLNRWTRAVLFVPVLLGLGCLHLISAGILFAFIGAWEFAGVILSRTGVQAKALGLVGRLPEAAVLLVPVLLLLLLSNQSESQTASYFSLEARVEALYSPFVFYLNWSPAEIGLGIAVFAVLAVGYAMRLVEISRRSAVMLATMLLVVLFAPASLSGVWGTHLRLPLPVMFVLLGCSKLSLAPRRIIAARGWAAATALVMAGHLAAASAQLSEQDARISEFRQAASLLPRGSTLLSAINLTAMSAIRHGGRFTILRPTP